MDFEPKRWRILADVLYDFGTSLEVLSPLCPHLFLQMSGLGNFAKVKVLDDSRPAFKKVTESFLNTFFPSGYPYSVNESVNEGYLSDSFMHLLPEAILWAQIEAINCPNRV